MTVRSDKVTLASVATSSENAVQLGHQETLDVAHFCAYAIPNEYSTPFPPYVPAIEEMGSFAILRAIDPDFFLLILQIDQTDAGLSRSIFGFYLE